MRQKSDKKLPFLAHPCPGQQQTEYVLLLPEILITARFFDSIVSNNRFQSFFGSINHNSDIVYDDQNFQLYHDFGIR